MLASRLGLTDAQKTQIQPILDAAKPQLKAIHDDARAKAQAVMNDVSTVKITPFPDTRAAAGPSAPCSGMMKRMHDQKPPAAKIGSPRFSHRWWIDLIRYRRRRGWGAGRRRNFFTASEIRQRR